MKSSPSTPSKLQVPYEPPSCEYYAAIYEFLQGHKPMIHWHIGSLIDIQEEDFMWVVIFVSAVPDVPRQQRSHIPKQSQYLGDAVQLRGRFQDL